MMLKQMLALGSAAFLGGIVGGMLSTQVFFPQLVEAQKIHG